MNKLKLFWDSIRSNPVFVAVSSAAVGAVVSGVQDEMASGKIDWSRGGINKLTGYAVTAAVAALVHLYRMPPNTTTTDTSTVKVGPPTPPASPALPTQEDLR